MFRVINNLIDRCFFTITFIFGVQLPAFIMQYQHRLSGHLSEAKSHLAQFQTIADLHYQGDLSAMIMKYQANSEPSIVNTAEVISQLMQRVEYLHVQINAITNKVYTEQVFNFLLSGDKLIISDTLADFAMTIPLEQNALATGATIALLSLLMKELIVYLLHLFKQKSLRVN